MGYSQYERQKFHSIKDEAQAITEQCGVYFSPFELEILSRKATEILRVLNKPCGITMNYQRIGLALEIVEKTLAAGCGEGKGDFTERDSSQHSCS